MTKIIPELVAIIPARGGSKGVPRKNIRPLGGAPLIYYSIRAAKECAGIDRVIVSTEDEEIASIARKCGAEVPFLRPGEFSGDNSNIQAAIDYTVSKLWSGGIVVGGYLALYPTHPFRNRSMMETIVSKIRNGKKNVITVKRIHSGRRLFVDANEIENLVFKNVVEEDHLFRNYGLVDGHRLLGGKGKYYHLVDNPVSLVDIDTYEDFERAERVIQNGEFDFDA